MSQNRSFEGCAADSSRVIWLALAIFMFGGCIPFARAQFSSFQAAPTGPEAVSFGPAAVNTTPSTATPFPSPTSRFAPAPAYRPLWSPIQSPGAFGNSHISAGGLAGFEGGLQPGAGLDPFAFATADSRRGSFAPLFPVNGGLQRDLPGIAKGPFGVATAAAPSLDQLMRNRVQIPAASPFGAFRFSYRDDLSPGTSGNDFRRNSTIFTTSNLGNGMFFSAGTSFSPAAGAPAAGMGGTSTSQAQKRSGSGVALKLTF